MHKSEVSTSSPILVTGAAGNIGSVGFKIVQILREKDLPVRAMVRKLDKRSEELAKLGAEVVVGDFTVLSDLHRVISGCKRIYFGMGVSDSYLEGALNTAAVARHCGVEVFVNISQMTVSQMSITETTDSHQQKYHWLVEQALNWSGLPVVHVRATVFLEHPFFTMFATHSIEHAGVIRLPFGHGRTSPIATIDVARVCAEILASPHKHIGKVYELTGPKSQDLNGIASEFSKALHRNISYVDVPHEEWKENDLKQHNLPTHIMNHFDTMAKLHHDNRYDRLTGDVEQITGVKPLTIEEWIQKNPQIFQNLHK